MASASTAGYYSAHRPQYGHTHSPQRPPSPPMDEPKCSLPSISNLLGIADAGSPTTEHSPAAQIQSPSTDAFHQGSYFKASSRPGSGYAHSHSHPHRGLPPTPPMSTDASFSTHSPSSKSSVSGPTGFYYETTPPLEADQHYRRPPPVEPVRHPSAASSYPNQRLPPTSYLDQPPSGTYYQNVPPPQPQVTSLYYQRPLPQAFPPNPAPIAVSMSPTSGPNPWQHHHYLSPSHGSAFPQSQDRYICSTCNKAFSRPSSLRIHSHSHTGEKPFKCPHAGCGKAFSVRSNMKRHERGCHSFEVGPGGPGLSA